MMALLVRESGPEAAPSIVFLHGGGVGGWSWAPQVSALREFHCLAPDLPEHGGSRDAGPFSIAGAARAVAELIGTRAHGGRAHVVGLSLGAQVAVSLLSQAPQVVDRAILSGTLVRPVLGAGLIAAMTALYMPFKNLDFLIRANMKSLGIPPAFYADFAADTRGTNQAALTRILIANMGFRLPDLSRANVRTLVVVGEKEVKVMHESARDLVRALPNGRGYVSQGVNHNWSLSVPERFCAMVRAWVADGPLPEGLDALT